MLPRSSSWALIKPKKEKVLGWKPTKTKEPDVGTYEPSRASPLVMTREPRYGIPKSKSTKFTVEFSNSKKHVPGVGNYEIVKSFNKITVPYMKKRI